MTVQHIIRRILVLFFLLCLPATVLLAASESYIQTLTGKIKQGDSCVVIDDKFLHLSLSDWNNIQHLSVDNIISFELRSDTSIFFYNKSFTCTLNVSVKYFTSRDQTVPEEINNVNLVVKYDTAKGAFYPADAHYKFKNAFKVVVVVNSITSQEWGSDIPALFRLKNQILVERKYPFNPNAIGPLQADLTYFNLQSNGVNALSLMASGFFTGTVINNNQLVVSWNPQHFGNPEEYDIEWTFIDRLSTNGGIIYSSYGNGASLPYAKATEWMVNDNTRVTLSSSSYTINLPYPDGYVLVRVRGVSYQANTNLRLTGLWDYDNGSGSAVCVPVTAHEPGMNYQYTAAFAEEGKRKEVINYFDATLRERQAITLSNSDLTLVPNSTTDRQETAIVQETIYDKMGRPAVSILPAPTNSKSLNYYTDFNVNSTGNAFSHTDITLSSNCVAEAGPLNVSSGASKYYSPGNPFKSDNEFYFTKYVPDAQQYPYSLTEYMPDNTGRIRRQGGVGNTFQPINGHATQYFYGKPGQRELDRLFGVEAGDCSHYLKNMIIDANGQASVSYIDANGRTVATALAGGPPSTLDALPSAAAGEPRARINETLIKPADFIANASGLVMTATSTFNAAVDQVTFDLHYSVNPAALITTHGQGQFCSNCYYDVLIEVRNNCGEIVATATTTPFAINNVACNANPQPVTGTLPVPIASRGSYNVSYTLRLSQNAVNYHTDYYIANNSDLKKLQAFFEEKLNELDLAGCYTTCEACKTLGSTPDAFRQKVLDLLGTDKFSGVQANSAVQQWITNTWNELKAHCNSISCNVTTACDDYLVLMKQQVIPGGQYALITAVEQNDVNVYSYVERTINVLRFYNWNDASNTEIYNFSYVDDNGNTVFIRDLSESDFIRAYIDHPEWADMFVKKHIEYCSYLFCKDQSFSPANKNNEASYNFDRTLRDLVTTGDEAISRGYYNRSNMNALADVDPFFNGGRGSSLKASMVNDLADFSNVIGFIINGQSGKNIFAFIDWALYCKPLTNTTDPNVFFSTWTSCSVNASCRSTTMEWELYRNYYLQLKSKYLNQVKAQVSAGCTDCFIGKDALLSTGNAGTLLTCAQGGSQVPVCPTMADFHIETEDIPDVNNMPYERFYNAKHKWLVYNNGNVPRKVNVHLEWWYDNLGNQDFGVIDLGWVSLEAGTDRVYLGMEYTEFIDDGDLTEEMDEHITYTLRETLLECPSVPNVIPSSVCMQHPNYLLYQNKNRVFNEFIDISSYLNCLNANPTPIPTDEENLNQFRAIALADLENLKLRWSDQLKAVRTEEAAFNSIGDGTIDDLVNALVEVAKVNIQRATTPETIRVASDYSGSAPAGVYSNFKAAFVAKVGASLVQLGFSQDLLERPYPYNRTPVDVNPNSGQINSTICTNLTQLKNRYNASGFAGSFYAYLKQELEEDMVLTSAQLQDLETRCTAGCRYLNEPVLLPVALATPAPANTDHPFVNCSRVNTLKSNFLNEYPGIDQSTKLYRVLFTNYCNHNLGYALGYSDYVAFSEKCSINSTAVLYNKPASPSVPFNDFICQGNSIMTAFERAGQEYDRYITLERIRFRNQYISKCLGNKASATIEGEQYEYHYTLYYYDQSGNLVKTIPPEGVRFLTESQIDQVQTLRQLNISSCEDDGITKVEDKTAALNTVSSVLQSNAAKSIELWLNNIDAANGSQVRFITPDHKYMYQAAIANQKLWVELYSLQPGTSGDIAITLSNQMVADIGSLSIQKWSHVVVQSNSVTADTWDVYLNGAKLTLLPPGNISGYPFDWSIIAGYTLPAEVIEPVKHVRLYNRLLSGAEVQENYANPCFSIAETLKGTNSPLLIWGRFNISSLCNPVSETVLVANQGALQVNANLNQETKGLPNVTNNFTVEFWVKPEQTHEIDAQSQSGTAGTSGQQYLIYPDDGGAASTNRAGMGISVGTNGVSVYELATAYMPSLLVWQGDMTGGKHVAVVYTNNTPSLYINGQLVKTGLTSTKQYVNPSYNFGGGTYGFMPGLIDEVRIWNVARTAQQISANYQQGITPSAVTGLVGYWPMDPENGAVVADVSCNHNNVALPGSGYNWVNAGSNIYNTVNRDALNNFIVPFHGLPTTYAYNSLNQVIKQTSPDGGVSRFWYDRLGKLTVSQNAEQLQPLTPGEPANRYSYTKYDAFDRIVEVGEKVNAGSSMTEVLARDNAGLQTWMQSGQNSQITQTIYDEAPSYAPGLLTNLRKRVAASIVLEGAVGSQRTAATYYSYDISGNTKTLYQENQKISLFDAATGIKRIDYDYDLVSGKVNKVKYQEGKGDQFYYRYRYDADNRVIEAGTSRDGLIWNTEATYRYYLHGPLARTELGHNKVQGLDYAYNLQGWLKGINSQQLDAGKDMSGDGLAGSNFPLVARDVMSFSLGYFNGDYQPIGGGSAYSMNYNYQDPNATSGKELFNGNISHTTLAINMLNNGALKGYTYRYDQLNRLKQMRMHDLAGGGTTWNSNSILPAYQENITYDGNGNIETYNRNGNIAGNYLMDDLKYHYNLDGAGQKVNNKLRHIQDNVPSNVYTTDIDGQTADYYQYDNIGNLKNEGGTSISWTLYGKIKQVTKTGQTIRYAYDAAGNRIVKSVESPGVSTQHTFYVRDAQGTVLGVYTRYVPGSGTDNNKMKWSEQHLYGSSRLGIWRPNIDVTSTWIAPGAGNGQFNIGEREYELSNHLGNILATISDNKTGIDVGTNGTIDYYEANVLTASDYYPFGMQMPGRIFNGGNYRYGFNGKENDNEVKGEGNQQDYGMRIYDPRIGKFLSVDPITAEYPELTPYQFASNTPIQAIDLDGLEMWAVNTRTGERLSGPINTGNLRAKDGWITGSYPTHPTAPATSSAKVILKPVHSEAPPVAVQQAKVRADKVMKPVQPEEEIVAPDLFGNGHIGKKSDVIRAMAKVRSDYYTPIGEAIANGPIAAAMYKLQGDIGAIRGSVLDQMVFSLGGFPGNSGFSTKGGRLSLPKFVPGTEAVTQPKEYSYRGLNSLNAKTLFDGEGVFGKNPNGTWSLEQHLILGSGKNAYLHDHWVSTSLTYDIAKSFSTGNGIIRIDLSKIPASSIQRGWMVLPRFSRGYHYSVWQQEVSISPKVPVEAISIMYPTSQ
ncbi:LamG-like jellyroll fold domain-containing protein [Niastella caeni]|nr:LamG-like jellyroll fold domain-containing protein [Niastella caeni]